MRVLLEGWTPGTIAHGDEADARFETLFDAPRDGVLHFDGIATLASVIVDGAEVACSSSMWVPVEVPITAGPHRIEVHCRALGPELAIARKPRARWRQKVASDNGLRWFRTSIHGRAPGFSPGPPVTGLWRPCWFIADEPRLALRTRVEDGVGILVVTTDLPDGHRVDIAGEQGEIAGGRAEVRIPSPELWWPHSHGEPVLHEVTIEGMEGRRTVGFRTLAAPRDIMKDGLKVRINEVDIFVRGALWTPVEPADVRSTLQTARDHGLNAVRIPGTMAYETREFHDCCDELGILVWQDLMFANFDYPFEDPDFRSLVGQELDSLFAVIGGRPSTFLVCGGSEIEQQAEMLGLDPSIARPPFFAGEVPAALESSGVDALYVPSAPCGSTRPLLAHEGVSNWFGVGGYRRPLSDIRSAGVRFASECLALANIGDEVPDPDDPAWKAGVQKDVGADWDFDDVRDYYLELLYGVDAAELRTTDKERWLALGRRVSGDVMSEVLGEWRRPESGCGGAFILWLRDLVPGAGWGLIDSEGRPKPVLRDLNSLLAPVAIWMTDEGMSGYALHVANDRSEDLSARIRVELSSSGRRVDDGEAEVTIPAHGHWTSDVETLIGHFADVGYTYRFGPPQHDLVTAELLGADGECLGSARRFPLGRSVLQ